ncbi:MAG: hypothetical protein ABIO45_16590 [Burkholderiaceae bacterium]
MPPLHRHVAPETLDGLAVDDPAAQGSRRDLRRIHRAMGTRRITLRALRGWGDPPCDGAPLRVLELGAGDASLMLGVARGLCAKWQRVDLHLLDRLPVVDPAMLAAYAALGWNARVEVRDVFEWVEDRTPVHYDLIVAHLFLHHFEGARLQALLGAIAARCDRFFACEPRRSTFTLAASHGVAALGANAVTREDAVLSVRAGFAGRELSAAWPDRPAGWRLDEYPAAPFSHCLHAQRGNAA